LASRAISENAHALRVLYPLAHRPPHRSRRGRGGARHDSRHRRREALRQISHGYAVLLAAEFQGYCRELHTEAVTFFATTIPAAQQAAVSQSLTLSRQLDRGNANPGSLGSDFGRLGLNWWAAVDLIDTAGPNLRRVLEELNAWRNAIAHNDFDPVRLGGTILLTLSMVRQWRRVCNRLAGVFDHVLADHLQSSLGSRPW
jgi:hypothetical protein